jgi:glycosyltransferase involved in cell wall biosynthesis
MVSEDPAAIVVDDFAPAQRSLRLAVVTETYPPEINGVAATVARLVNGLRARNHELQLIRPRQDRADAADRGDRFHEILLRGLPIPNYPSLKMGLPSKRALVKLWAVRRPDLVHVCTEGPLGWSALRAARLLRLPVTSEFRTNFHAYSKHYGVGWLARPIVGYLRKFHNRCEATMVPTEALRGELARYGFAKLHVVARGVDTRLFDPAHRSAALRQTWGADAQTTVVLHVGRLAPEKNLNVLSQAFEAMRAVDPRCLLVFVGDGPQRARLQARHPQAIFAGMRTGAELAAYYASGDVFLFPSETETFGNVVPEAMASGLAVVAYDYAAAAQLIRSGTDGLLAPCSDADAFVAQAAALARTADLRHTLGLAARTTALAHGWEAVVEQIEAVMRAALRSGSAPHSGAALQVAAHAN